MMNEVETVEITGPPISKAAIKAAARDAKEAKKSGSSAGYFQDRYVGHFEDIV